MDGNIGLCCVNSQGNCGSYTRYRKTIDQLFGTDELTNDTKACLVRLKLLHVYESRDDLTEKLLIESRLGFTISSNDKICAYHRYTLGVDWRPPSACLHHDHEKTKGKKAPVLRNVSLKLIYGTGIPIGGKMCNQHYSQLISSGKQEQQQQQQPVNVNDESSKDDNDPLYVPDSMNVTPEMEENSEKILNGIETLLGTSPSKLVVKRKFLDDLCEDSHRYIKRKLKETLDETKSRFLEAIAPGQGAALMKRLDESSNKDSNEDSVEQPADLQHMIQKYMECDNDSLAQMVILSLVDHKMYSKNDIMKYFPGSTKHQIDKARKYCIEESFSLPRKTKHKRKKLDILKCEHFLDFIFNTGLLQDVAYGVTKIKFDSGEEQKVAHAILTTKYTHAITFYYQMCHESVYAPLSKSSLFNILKALKPSQRKNLSGLDDTQAAAMNGFENLMKAAKSMSDSKDITLKLEQGKRYLKTRYQHDCAVDSVLASHNQFYALSDTKTELSENSNISSDHVSSSVYNLFYAMNAVSEMAQKTGDNDKIYDVKTSINDVVSYIKHQIRDSQQSKAKVTAFDELDSNTAFWLKDYAQKVLPEKHREGQKDYFGKKGMTVHIDVVLTKKFDEIVKYVYYTVVYRCEQGLEDTLCISENVLKEIVKDLPDVTKIFMKSDNASCYHGNYSAEINHRLCKRKNIKLVRYDFNEPQKGKDQCDREAAPAKNQLRAYVEAGNDIQTAEDIYNALHYAKGLKDSKVCVAEIDTEKTMLKCNKTKNVSTYHSIVYEEKGMRMRRYHAVGKGVVQNYCDCDFESGLSIKIPFHSTETMSLSSTPKQKNNVKVREDRKLCTLYFCPTNGCKEAFEDKHEYDNHVMQGNHVITKERGAMDVVRKSFVSRMKSLSNSYEVFSSEASTMAASNDVPLMSMFAEPGWALPLRSNFRYTYKQKKFLYDRFIEGEVSGKKKSPEQVHLDMRKEFSPSEYVTVQQIKSLFSRMSSEQRKGVLKEPTVTNDELNNEDGGDAEDQEIEPNTIRNTAYSVMTKLLVECDKWVMVLYDEEMFPGIVKEVSDGTVKVQCMEYELMSENSFRWPAVDDINNYEYENIISSIEAPRITGVSAKNKRKDVYAVTDDDWSEASNFINEFNGI